MNIMKNLSALTKVKEFRLKLYPHNFDTVREFYEKFLGFTVTHEWNNAPDNRGVMFDVGGTILEIMVSRTRPKGITASIALEVSDVRKLWEEFMEYPKLIHALRDNDWGDSSFAIYDPEGTSVTFFTRK
ncbi:MAG: VOC family protein [bacterium]|nr:VOC family protein [bacterium]